MIADITPEGDKHAMVGLNMVSQSGSSVGEDLKKLAYELGYTWPDDDAGRWHVLKLMAQTAAHWRTEVGKCQSELWPEIERERIMELKCQRIAALARKLRNTRMALRDYMKSQAAFVREGLAELRQRKQARDRIAALEAELRRLSEVVCEQDAEIIESVLAGRQAS